MTGAITVDDVSKRFKLYTDRRSSLKERFVRGEPDETQDFWALRNVSLEVPQGSTYGLIGHNGSGKSTLLKLMAGIHRPTSGIISADGRISALLELGAGFHPELSGRDNIMLNGSILGMSRKQVLESIDKIIDFSGLEEKFIDTPVKVYSSGMYVRLGFAIAVNLDPEILLIDEIVAVGDENFQRKCFDHLRYLRSRGTTIVFVSHSLALVQTLCDHVAWLDHGELQLAGPSVGVVDEYLSQVNDEERERLIAEDVLGLDREETEQHGSTRRGSGEISITGVTFHDASGAQVPAVDHNDRLTVRIGYRAEQPITDPGFGLAFITEHGLPLAGPNTKLSGARTGTISGTGHIEFVIDRLPLNPGPYAVTAAITDDSTTHVYDLQDKAYTLHVQPGPGFQPSGYVVVDGRWTSPTS